MSLSATTKLEAVNIMLSTIGENPVNSLTSGLVDAELAETILGSVSKAVQSEGWNFNTEKKVSFIAEISGHIILPANILRAAAPGTGIIAGGPMRALFESLGIKDVVAKSTGTSNPHNMLKATLNEFKISESPKSVAAKRSKKINDITSSKNS